MTGLTRVARRAGSTHEIMATTLSTTVIAVIVIGSSGSISTSWNRAS